jgi:GMP synthase (glutamine-hydrolysing)
MARVIACLHHLDEPILGLAGPALTGAGLEISEHDVGREAALPLLDEVAGLISFGGDQSVSALDGHGSLAAELRLIAEAVERELPVLGVCLGGQLLARALGAAVGPMPRRMLGWYDVQRREESEGDPLFGALPSSMSVLHWNEDAFELPAGAVELLSRPGPGVEAFRSGPSAWGIQFHPEVDAAVFEHWCTGYPEQLAEADVTAAQARAAQVRHMPAQEALAARLFGAFARVVAERVPA